MIESLLTRQVEKRPDRVQLAGRILFLADGNIVKELGRSEPSDVVAAMEEISLT